MGHSRHEKADSHRRIVKVAARKMRESGTEGPGVAEIMKAAGLTHGGFYKHFDSRDDLVAEAVEAATAEGLEGFEEATEGAADPLAAFVDRYLSPGHRDDPGSGCAVVALGADAARADDRVRAVYRAQVERYIAELEELMGGGADVRRRAIAAVTSMVGALLVARAVDDADLSDEILGEVRASLRSPASRRRAARPSRSR
ncbi:MAG TPA: TetR/AcrR family transcriptional regulator [Solirubrobacterales bacterium]|nr:TetR/AcrR family transcriptional regulator [Solirubrobacterales bacterium]